MATTEVLRDIVTAGADLVLLQSRATDTLIELCEIAAQSGAKVTVSTDQHSDLIRMLAQRFPRTVAFVDGIPKAVQR